MVRREFTCSTSGVDEREIRVGDYLVGKNSEALKDADYLVIVLSQASVSSRPRTLGEFALEPDPPHLERIPPEESDSDLFRSNDPDAVALSCQVESPQSVVQGCPAQGSAIGPGEKES